MSNNIAYRVAEENDYSRIHKVVKEVQDMHASNRPDIFISVDILFPEHYFLSLLKNNDNVFYVAEDIESTEIIGFLILETKRYGNAVSSVPRTIGYITFYGVLSDYSRRGIGQNLLEKGIEWCKKRGIMKMEFKVWSFNTDAMVFFKKRGFVEDSVQLSLNILQHKTY